MRGKILGLLLATILLSGCNLIDRKSGIEIISYPTAKVLIDEKEAGMTPYKNNSLKPGEIEVKLTAGELSWTKKIHLENGANTVINREFGKNEADSGGYTLYFESTGDEQKAGLLISSKPDRAAVYIDDEIKGYSPIRIEDVGEGDKKLVLSYPGYKSVSSYVKFIKGYQLVVDGDLAKEETIALPIQNEDNDEASNSGELKKIETATILSTETGWLRVRSEAGSGTEITKVKPGEKYTITEEKEGWYKIDLGQGKGGWISTKYAAKSSE